MDVPAGQVIDLAPRVSRQVWVTGDIGVLAGHLANAAWTVAGAIAIWFTATYSSLVSDLR